MLRSPLYLYVFNFRSEHLCCVKTYSTITLPQVKDTRDRALAYLASLPRLLMTATQAGAEELTSKQHHQWNAKLSSNSWTNVVKDMMTMKTTELMAS